MSAGHGTDLSSRGLAAIAERTKSRVRCDGFGLLRRDALLLATPGPAAAPERQVAAPHCPPIEHICVSRNYEHVYVYRCWLRPANTQQCAGGVITSWGGSLNLCRCSNAIAREREPQPHERNPLRGYGLLMRITPLGGDPSIRGGGSSYLCRCSNAIARKMEPQPHERNPLRGYGTLMRVTPVGGGPGIRGHTGRLCRCLPAIARRPVSWPVLHPPGGNAALGGCCIQAPEWDGLARLCRCLEAIARKTRQQPHECTPCWEPASLLHAASPRDGPARCPLRGDYAPVRAASHGGGLNTRGNSDHLCRCLEAIARGPETQPHERGPLRGSVAPARAVPYGRSLSHRALLRCAPASGWGSSDHLCRCLEAIAGGLEPQPHERCPLRGDDAPVWAASRGGGLDTRGSS